MYVYVYVRITDLLSLWMLQLLHSRPVSRSLLALKPEPQYDAPGALHDNRPVLVCIGGPARPQYGFKTKAGPAPSTPCTCFPLGTSS